MPIEPSTNASACCATAASRNADSRVAVEHQRGQLLGRRAGRSAPRTIDQLDDPVTAWADPLEVTVPGLGRDRGGNDQVRAKRARHIRRPGNPTGCRTRTVRADDYPLHRNAHRTSEPRMLSLEAAERHCRAGLPDRRCGRPATASTTGPAPGDEGTLRCSGHSAQGSKAPLEAKSSPRRCPARPQERGGGDGFTSRWSWSLNAASFGARRRSRHLGAVSTTIMEFVGGGLPRRARGRGARRRRRPR